MVVAGAGTGGTIAGIGRKMKQKIPNVTVGPTFCFTVNVVRT